MTQSNARKGSRYFIYSGGGDFISGPWASRLQFKKALARALRSDGTAKACRVTPNP